MPRVLITAVFLLLVSFQTDLHAFIEIEKMLTPQGNFIPGGSAFKPVRTAFKGFAFEKAIWETEKLMRHRKNPEVSEAAAYLLGDLYWVIAKKNRPLLYKKAISAYRDARIRYPDSERSQTALMRMGVVYTKIAFYYEALGSYDRIIKKHPLSPYVVPARILRGHVYLKWEKFDKAIEALDEINPAALSEAERTGLLLNYAGGYFLMEKPRAAYEYYKLVSLQNPILQSSQKHLYQYGLSAYRSKTYKIAREALFILHNKYPRGNYSLLAMARIGDAYRLEGQLKRAKKAYKHVYAARKNKYGYNRSNLIAAVGTLHLEGCEKARCRAERALQSEAGRLALKKIKKTSHFLIRKQRSSFSENLILEAALALERHAIFEPSFHLARLLKPEKVKTLFHKKVSRLADRVAIASVNQLLNKDKTVEALGIFYQRREVFLPGILTGRMGLELARGFARAALYQEAVDLLLPIIEMSDNPYRQIALFRTIESYFHQNDYPAAEKQIKAYLSLYPNSLDIPALRILSAEISFKQGKKITAVKKYNRWLMRYKTHKKRTEILTRLADAYVAVGNLKQAAIIYEKAKRQTSKRIPGLAIKIADTLFRLKQYQRSLPYYRDAIEEGVSAEQVDWATFQLAQSYEKLGKKDKGTLLYENLGKNAAEHLIQAVSKQKTAKPAL
ncbi:MAG: tetratricopeptide repeat protein [Nitrospiria bacterium]